MFLWYVKCYDIVVLLESTFVDNEFPFNTFFYI